MIFNFSSFLAIGDYNGHLGLGVWVSREVAPAIYEATKRAKLSIAPIQRGYWSGYSERPVKAHTVPCKLTGQYGSVLVRLLPAPPRVGIVATPVPKILIEMAGIEDCYLSIRGSTGSTGDLAQAVNIALRGSN